MIAPTSTLFENATIISYEEATKSLKPLRGASLLVEDGRITQLSKGTLCNVPEGAEVIDATNKIISPGFINTHHHMWQSAFRTIASNTTLSEYLSGRHSQTGPAGKHFTPNDIYLGQMACALEMIDGGTTTVLDHAHAVFSNDHIDAAVNASFECGLRIFFAPSIQPIETTGYTPEKGIAKLLELAKDPRFQDRKRPAQLGVAYDGWAFAPAEVNSKFLDLMINHNNDAASTGNAPISVLTTHHVGGPYACDNNPTTLHALPTSALTQSTLTTKSKIPVIFSHASFLTNAEAKLIRAHPHVSISTTPESETHYGHTSIGADMCQDCASLGVDTHFTFSSYMPFQARLWLQLLREMRYKQIAADRWQTPANNPMDCEAAFLLMTQKGGESLGRSDLGVIKVGAQADLVVFDTKKRAALWAVRDPVAAVVLHTGSGGDVDGVMVQGRWLKKDHQIVSPLGGGTSVDDLRDRFEESALRIQKIWESSEPGVGPLNVDEGDKNLFGGTYGRCQPVNVTRQA